MLDQGGKEYAKGVPGQGLAKADPPAKAVRHKAFFLDELPGPLVRLLKEPLRDEGCWIFPVFRVLKTETGWGKK